MPVRRTRSTSVQRKVQFFRVTSVAGHGGSSVPFDPMQVLNHLDGIPLSSGQRHWQHDDSAATCCWIDSGGFYPRMRLANIRLAGLPLVEEGGVLADLDIPAAAGLAEPVHIVFFHDQVIGVEYNHYGPRVARLRDYLSEKALGICPPINIEPLVRRDALEQLQRLQSVRVFRLKVRPSFADRVRDADESLAAALEASRAFSGGEFVEIIARAEPNSRSSSLLERVKDTARLILTNLRDDVTATDSVSALEISGYDVVTGKVETVDLLSDMLVSSQQIVAPRRRTRALSSASAYEAIERAYLEVRDQLPTAGTVVE